MSCLENANNDEDCYQAVSVTQADPKHENKKKRRSDDRDVDNDDKIYGECMAYYMDAVDEIHCFVKGDQISLLKRVLPSIAKHFHVKKSMLPRVLWLAGVELKKIDKLILPYEKT